MASREAINWTSAVRVGLIRAQGVAMTLSELRYLVALANRAHFGRAAEDCQVSQPTLSNQIRKLEEYLGVTLIARNGKSFSLTAVGQEVVDKARLIVLQVMARPRSS